jgi:hypothetical protein
LADITKNRECLEKNKALPFGIKNKETRGRRYIRYLQREQEEIFRAPTSPLLATIIAFGRDAYSVLTRNIKNECKIFKIPHYSNYNSREKYREEVKCHLKHVLDRGID